MLACDLVIEKNRVLARERARLAGFDVDGRPRDDRPHVLPDVRKILKAMPEADCPPRLRAAWDSVHGRVPPAHTPEPEPVVAQNRRDDHPVIARAEEWFRLYPETAKALRESNSHDR